MIVWKYVWRRSTYRDIILRRALEYRQQGLNLSEIVMKLAEENILIGRATLWQWLRRIDELNVEVYDFPIYTWKQVKDSVELSKKVLNRAAELRRQGLPYVKICAKLRKEGVSVDESILKTWMIRELGEDPLKKRYDDLLKRVKELHELGFGYTRISKELAKDGIWIPRSTIATWLRGKRLPWCLRKRRYQAGMEITSEDLLALLEPSPELAYIIGAMIGDGHAYEYEGVIFGIVLHARDFDFVDEVARCAGKVLRRRPPTVEVFMQDGKPMYQVRVYNRILYKLVVRKSKSLATNDDGRRIERIRPFVEFNDACRSAFLRGFFDAEGTASGGIVMVYNTSIEILQFVQEQLKALGIETTGIRLPRRGGRVTKFPHRVGVSRKDVYSFKIRRSSFLTFMAMINFTIRRKRERLEEIVRRMMARRLRL